MHYGDNIISLQRIMLLLLVCNSSGYRTHALAIATIADLHHLKAALEQLALRHSLYIVVVTRTTYTNATYITSAASDHLYASLLLL